MKIRLLTIICLFIAGTAAIFGAEPTIKFNTEKHDFGNIKEAAGPATATFTFTNTGDAPLAIISAKTSCGCTFANYPKKPIMPGKSDNITVSYNPMGRPGEFLKEIRVKTNDKNKKNVKLIIKGNVIPSNRK